MAESNDGPPVFTVESLKEHRQSIIVLHGRGDQATRFGGPLLFTKLPNGQTFREALPNAKFFFPNAPLVWFEGLEMYEWFKISSLKDPSENQDEQIDGLTKSTKLVHKLLQREIKVVGAENIVLGGLSQGCATALISLALWDGPPLKAAFGMSGWLPMLPILKNTLTNPPEPGRKGLQAVSALREAFGSASEDSSALFKTPMLICHGELDNKVAPKLGEEAVDCLRELGCTVEWKSYKDLPHWYDGEELQHITSFIARSHALH